MEKRSKAGNKLFILEAAQKWFSQGFNIVPILFDGTENGKIGKRPLCKEWRQWQSRRQTLEEFEAFDWERADGFAIICSHPNIEGLYLAVVDYDIKGNLTEEAKLKGKELLKLFPPTRVEKTIGGGLHLVYLTKAKPERVTKFHDTYALELIGGDMLCVMAPSRGYEVLHDRAPTVVENISEIFYQILHNEAETKASANKLQIDTPIEGKLELSSDGWVFEYKGKKIVFFNDVMGDESIVELANQLGVTPKEAWSIKNKLLEFWSPTLNEIRYLFPMIIGEDKNVVLAILALFSLKLKNPEERIMGVRIEAQNSAGKSYFSKQVLSPLKDQVYEFSRVTGAFAERFFAENNIDGKILYLQEISQAPYQIHLSMSEGRLVVGFVDRVDKKLQPIIIEANGYPFVWATTNEWHGSPDFIHRTITITLDESVEQTRRITEFQAKLSADYFFRVRLERFANGCMKIFRKLWDSAPSNCIVIIPYLQVIQTELTKADNLNIKFRRDFNKLVALIKSSAILNYKKRVKFDIDNSTVIIAEFDDFLEVYQLMETTLRPTLTNLSEKDRLILNALRELETEPSTSTYSALARKTNIPSSTIRHYIIPKLESLGYVVVDRESRPHRIELLKDVPEKRLNIDDLRSLAEKLIRDAVAKLSSLSQMAKREISPIQASIEEKEPAGLAVKQTANDLSFSVENSQESSSVNGWPIGRETELTHPSNVEQRVCSQCIHWDALKCSRHPEWVTISPHSRDAEGCNFYKPKGP